MKKYNQGKIRRSILAFFAAIAMLVSGLAIADGTVKITGTKYNTSLPTSTKPDGKTVEISVDAQGRLHTSTQAHYHFDSCNAITGWAVINNDTDSIASSANHTLGTSAISFAKVNGAGNSTTFGIKKDITSVSMEPYHSAGGYFLMNFYLPSLTNFETFWFRAGTDASNYNEWRISADGMSEGWNAVKISMGQPSAYAGTGWSTQAVTWIAVGGIMTAEADTQAGFIIDHISANAGLQTSSDITSEVTSEVNTAAMNLKKLRGNLIDRGAGDESNATLRVIEADDSPAVALTLDDDYTAGSIALTASSADFTLPHAGGAYVVCAIGNTAYIECGSSPTVAIAADGFTFVVAEGSCIGPMRLAGTKCAAIAATAAGYINYLSLD